MKNCYGIDDADIDIIRKKLMMRKVENKCILSEWNINQK